MMVSSIVEIVTVYWIQYKEQTMNRLLDMLIWIVVTLFSPAAGLNESEEESEVDNGW